MLFRSEGIGIGQEKIKGLFKLFRKEYNAESLNPQGMGMGLYLANKLSKRLGGNIVVTSKEGEGTKISFYINAKIIEKSSVNIDFVGKTLDLNYEEDDTLEFKELVKIPTMCSTMMEIKRKKLKRSCNCSKVLIVDDEALNIYVLQSYLRSVGIESDTAINGREALNMIDKKYCNKCNSRYEVILMDINMPIMGGIECTREIQRRIETHKIPHTNIIAVTAAAHLEDAHIFSEYQTIGFSKICKFFFNTYSTKTCI